MSGSTQGSPGLTGPSTPDTFDNSSSTQPATYAPGYRTLVNPYSATNWQESGLGQNTSGAQPDNATLTNPWPVAIDLANAILTEVQTRYRLLAAINMRPSITDDEILTALLDAVDRMNNYPPATQFTVTQLFHVGADPRFRGPFYLCVAERLCMTLVWDWTANGFDQAFNNFKVETKLEDYHRLQGMLTEQVETQLKHLKESSQKFIRRVLPANQSMIRTAGVPYRRGMGGGYTGNGYGSGW